MSRGLARCPFVLEGVYPLLRGEGSRRPGEGVSGWFAFHGEQDVAGKSGFDRDRLSWLK